MAVFGQRAPLPTFSSHYGSCANQRPTPSNMANFSDQQKNDGINRKRPLDANSMDEIDAPAEKKRFEQFSDDFSNFNLNSPVIYELEDDEVMDPEDLPTTSSAIIEDEPEFYVEEPPEPGQLVLSDSLHDYLKRMKSEHIVPMRRKNNELVLYTPADAIRSRIVEITDADHSDDESEEPPKVQTHTSTPAASPTRGVQAEMEDEKLEGMEQMEID